MIKFNSDEFIKRVDDETLKRFWTITWDIYQARDGSKIMEGMLHKIAAEWQRRCEIKNAKQVKGWIYERTLRHLC